MSLSYPQMENIHAFSALFLSDIERNVSLCFKNKYYFCCFKRDPNAFGRQARPTSNLQKRYLKLSELSKLLSTSVYRILKGPSYLIFFHLIMAYLLGNFKQKVILWLPKNSEQSWDTADCLDSLHSIPAQQSHPNCLIPLFSNT